MNLQATRRSWRLWLRSSSCRSSSSSTDSLIPDFAALERVDVLDYELPSHRIAVQPVRPRSASRMLVASESLPPHTSTRLHLRDCTFRDIVEELPENSLLVVNDTRVVAARLYLQRRGGKGPTCEVLCVSPRMSRDTNAKNDRDEMMEDDPSSAMEALSGESRWLCFVRGKRIRVDEELVGAFEGGLEVRATVEERTGKESILRFYWREPNGNCTFGHVLERCGHMPLPPYMKRAAEDSDKTAYQTIFHGHGEMPTEAIGQHSTAQLRESPGHLNRGGAAGSVAAPTAGLHFDRATVQALATRRPDIGMPLRVTLHVGGGTFSPLGGDLEEFARGETLPRVACHTMHSEHFHVTVAALDALISAVECRWCNGSRHRRPIFAVGTTSLRTLESLYWLGLRAWLDDDENVKAEGPRDADGGGEHAFCQLGQWDYMELECRFRDHLLRRQTSQPGEVNSHLDSELLAPEAALKALRRRVRQGGDDSVLRGTTQLMIVPGYRFVLVQGGLLTNFHQRRSTLLLLVAALVGGKKALDELYSHALLFHDDSHEEQREPVDEATANIDPKQPRFYQHPEYRFLSYGDCCLLFTPEAQRRAAQWNSESEK